MRQSHQSGLQHYPWPEIEKRYAALFTNRKGNVAKPLRLAPGACIIQAKYGFSDEETALQIQESPYLQYLCGYAGYDDSKKPFDPSLMVYFRKRLTPEVLGEIDETIPRDAAKKEPENDGDDGDDDGSVSQPLVRPIVQGKAGKPAGFGAKLDINVVDGWARLEYCSFDAYKEAGNLQEIAEFVTRISPFVSRRRAISTNFRVLPT